MKIVADKDIFGVEEYFGTLGDLQLLPGREISPGNLADAEVLLVRTVTRIDERLVGNSGLRFVGSATSGTDHVNIPLLAEMGIHFCHAPGCNADAVVDYVFAVLALLAGRRGADWRHWSAGIIGAGNVGGRLARKLESLGMDFCIYDPLLHADHPLSPQFSTLEEVMQQDVVSIHTPLTSTGEYPTCHMLDRTLLQGMARDAVLINAARGEVVDNLMLAGLLAQRPDLQVALDVWEHEPAVYPPLLDRVAIATPHIAGYSLNGKRNGTAWVYRQFCEYFALDQRQAAQTDGTAMLAVADGGSTGDLLNRIILAAYPVARDSRPLELARRFDELRNGYPLRAEFSAFSLDGSSLPRELVHPLQVLGFRVM